MPNSCDSYYHDLLQQHSLTVIRVAALTEIPEAK